MNKRLLLFGALLVIAIILATLLREFVYQIIVVPILLILWLGRVAYQSIHQAAMWVLLITASLIIAWRSLRKPGRRRAGAYRPPLFRPGRVEVWANWSSQATSGHYTKWRFARQLAELTVEVLAYREQLTTRQVRQYLKTGQLDTDTPAITAQDLRTDVPEDIRLYLQAGLNHISFGRFSTLRYVLRRRSRPSPLEIDPDQVVRFLETELEVPRDH